MTESSKPNSAPDKSIERRLTETPTFAEQVFLFPGRYGRKKFWLWSLALPALMIFMMMPLAAMNSPTGGDGGPGVLFLMSLPFLWLYSKLIIHRLHDFGRSGWWFLVLGPLFIVLPIFMFRESNDIYLRIEQSYEAQQAIKGYVIFMLFGSFTIFLGGFILMGCLRGTNGPNKYGPDPRGEPKPSA